MCVGMAWWVKAWPWGSLAWSHLEIELQGPVGEIGGEKPWALIDLGKTAGITAQIVFRGRGRGGYILGMLTRRQSPFFGCWRTPERPSRLACPFYR